MSARRNLDSRQLFVSHEISEVVHHSAEIINAVGVGNIGVPGLALAHLLRAPMMKADLRNAVNNDFAIELQNNSQHAMSSRMLRTHVQEDEIARCARPLHPPFFGSEPKRFLLGFLLVLWKLEGSHFCCASGMILTQWMPHPTLGHQNTGKVRVAVKNDAKHIPHFAFIPVRRRPDIGNRWKAEGVRL